MAETRSHTGKSYGATTISGPATAHLGDTDDHSTNFIKHAHFHFRGDHATPSTLAPLITDHVPSDPSGKGFALLVFDGGIVGGLSDLYILKNFMEKVAQAGSLRDVPKPCEFFDMISGTSIGG